MITYEQKLDGDRWWALSEGGRYFQRDSLVHKTLGKVTRLLEDLEIAYAVTGDLAMFFHGFRKFTEVVDIVVSREGFESISRRGECLGYVPDPKRTRSLREVESGVRINFLIAGEYPGDGKPKAVVLPFPESASEVVAGVRCLRLSSLIETKLAAGISTPRRLQDIADVQQLIAVLHLPVSLGEQVQPSVKGLYLELWHEVQNAPPDPE